MEFKYLALGILVGYLAPYTLALLKAKKDPDSFTSQQETIFSNDDQNNY